MIVGLLVGTLGFFFAVLGFRTIGLVVFLFGSSLIVYEIVKFPWTRAAKNSGYSMLGMRIGASAFGYCFLIAVLAFSGIDEDKLIPFMNIGYLAVGIGIILHGLMNFFNRKS